VNGTPSLFDKTIDKKFAEFHAANPHVYATLVRLAREARGAGKTRIGMKALWERMRWDLWLSTKHNVDEAKLNNDFTSRFARLIEEREPDLRGMFETRRLRAA
jgi:hypothetical protein